MKCDIFSLGSLFFNLITGRYLFNGSSKQQVLQKNKVCNLSRIPEYLEESSPECKELMMWMLEIDPGMRPTAKQALMHDWFTTEQEIIRELLHVNEAVCKPNLPMLNFIGEMPLGNSVLDVKGEAFNSF